MPNVKAIIIGCADMRVDPSHVLGIKPGEAVVIRNIGGRITPGLLELLGLLGRIGQVAGAIPGGRRRASRRIVNSENRNISVSLTSERLLRYNMNNAFRCRTGSSEVRATHSAATAIKTKAEPMIVVRNRIGLSLRKVT